MIKLYIKDFVYTEEDELVLSMATLCSENYVIVEEKYIESEGEEENLVLVFINAGKIRIKGYLLDKKIWNNIVPGKTKFDLEDSQEYEDYFIIDGTFIN